MFVDQAPASAAVLPILPPSTQFDITGFLQAATLDQACLTSAAANLDSNGFPQAAHCGGTMTLNGHTIIVPAETVAIFRPARSRGRSCSPKRRHRTARRRPAWPWPTFPSR